MKFRHERFRNVLQSSDHVEIKSIDKIRVDHSCLRVWQMHNHGALYTYLALKSFTIDDARDNEAHLCMCNMKKKSRGNSRAMALRERIVIARFCIQLSNSSPLINWIFWIERWFIEFLLDKPICFIFITKYKLYYLYLIILRNSGKHFNWHLFICINFFIVKVLQRNSQVFLTWRSSKKVSSKFSVSLI